MAATGKTSWAQFTIKSTLLLMLLVAVFFAGRASMQPEVKRLRFQAEQEAQAAAKARQSAEQAQRASLQALDTIVQQKLADVSARSAPHETTRRQLLDSALRFYQDLDADGEDDAKTADGDEGDAVDATDADGATESVPAPKD